MKWLIDGSKKVKGPSGNMRYEINLAAVWGQIVTGSRYSKMSDMLATMGVPSMSDTTF